jgi:SulP family sulfate permease
MTEQSGAVGRSKSWPVFLSLQSYHLRFVTGDLIAGLTLAAIAIPEQMATARLGGFAPQIGFFAFLAGTLAFAALGSNRFLSCGADSTITPIFAGSLALMASTGSPDYALLAAVLALLVGVLMIAAGIFRLGWIADLLSIPVTAGFLAGISIHILLSQLPGVLGVPAANGSIPQRIWALASHVPEANPYTLAIGLGVLGLVAIAEWWDARIPGALIGLVLASASVAVLGLQSHGVAVLGTLDLAPPSLTIPLIAPGRFVHLVPLGLIIAAVVMMQTAATTRAFPSNPDEPPDVDRDFVGAGLGSLLAGLVGAFPVNASPPRTAIVSETGGRSQLAALTAGAIIVLVLVAGGSLLRGVPQAALGGVLLFVGLKIIRFRQIAQIARQSPGELLLIGATAAAIIALPIEQGVGIGIALSLLHGLWSTARAQVLVFERVPGTSIWWPASSTLKGEREPGILVVGFQAPLSFLNVYHFRRDLAALRAKAPDLHLIVLEGAGLLEIDFTAAQVLRDIIKHLHESGVDFAIARLESRRAEEDMKRLGIVDLLGPGHVFQSAEDACRALGGTKA